MSQGLRRAAGDLQGRALWVVVGALICQTGLGYGYLFSPLQDPVVADLGWTRTGWSAAVGSRIWINALATALVGFVTVRYGARVVIAGACVLSAVTYLLMSRMTQLWQLWALIPFVGLILASFGDVPVGHVVTRWVERRRGLALGIVYGGSNLGGAIVIPLAAFLAAEFSWRVACAGTALALALVIAPFAIFVVREPRTGEGIGEAEASADDEGSQLDLDVHAALRTRSFWLLAVNLFATFAYYITMVDQLVAILTHAGMSATRAAGIFGLIVGMGVIAKIAMGVIADRIAAPRAMQLHTALLGVSSALLFLLPEPVPLWLFVLAYGFASPARDVLYPMIIVHCFGLRYMAAIYGVLMLALLAGTLGSVAAAAARDQLGSYDRAFALYVGLNAVSLVAVCLLRRERGRIRPGRIRGGAGQPQDGHRKDGHREDRHREQRED